jgi:periplasmic protein TonB
MYCATRRPPLARRAAMGGVVLAVHALAVAGFLQVRAPRSPVATEVAVSVAFVEGPRQDSPAPERPKVRLDEVKPVFPDLPQIDLPIVVQAPVPTAISVSAPVEAAPPAAPTRASADAPVVVASVDYLKPPAPRYPPKARRTRAEGTVLLQVLIDTQGHAREVQIHRSSGHEELDAAARDAVLAAAFRPYVENGVARTALVIVPIEFALTIRTASR